MTTLIGAALEIAGMKDGNKDSANISKFKEALSVLGLNDDQIEKASIDLGFETKKEPEGEIKDSFVRRWGELAGIINE